MSRSLNRVMLIGHAGKDAELKYTASGIPVATFSMATTEYWKGKDGSSQEQTEWHNVVVWRNSAEYANKVVRKGSKLYVEGKIQTRTVDDNNGGKRYFTEIVADNIIPLDSNSSNRKQEDDVSQIPNTASSSPDDIPF